jgi:streptogramin lyase
LAAVKLLAALLLAVSTLLAAAAGAAAAPAINGIFPVKGIDTNSKIVAGPDGNMWVTLVGPADDVARITPAGEVKPFDLLVAGTTGIAVADGKLWVTSTEAVTSFSANDPEGSKQTTARPTIKGEISPLVAGPDGNIWVASKEVVIEFPPGNPAGGTEIPVAQLSPRDIDAAGSFLVISDGGPKNRIEGVSTAGTLGELSIGGASQGVAGGPNGQFAFSVPGAKPEQVGLAAPAGPVQFSELLNDPFGVVFGPDGAYWIAQFSGQVTRMTTTGVKTELTGLPKESPRQIAAGPGNTLWVTLSKNEAEGVARISGVEAPSAVPLLPPSPKPQTRIGKGLKSKIRTTGKRARVSIHFSSSIAGSKFECALHTVLKRKKGKKAPKPRFKSCKSPKTYHLKPGRYRFKVRAVANGLTDGTPASRAFSVIHVDKR